MITKILNNPWVLLLMGVVLLASAVHGLVTGRASLFVPGGFTRSENPFQYWSAIIALSIGGVWTLAIFVAQVLVR